MSLHPSNIPSLEEPHETGGSNRWSPSPQTPPAFTEAHRRGWQFENCQEFRDKSCSGSGSYPSGSSCMLNVPHDLMLGSEYQCWHLQIKIILVVQNMANIANNYSDENFVVQEKKNTFFCSSVPRCEGDVPWGYFQSGSYWNGTCLEVWRCCCASCPASFPENNPSIRPYTPSVISITKMQVHITFSVLAIGKHNKCNNTWSLSRFILDRKEHL